MQTDITRVLTHMEVTRSMILFALNSPDSHLVESPEGYPIVGYLEKDGKRYRVHATVTEVG